MINYNSRGHKQLKHFNIHNPLLTKKEIEKSLGRYNKMAEWKKVEGDIFKFEKVGDTIEGELVDVQKGAQFDNKVYKIKTSKGIMTVFGTAVLDSSLSNVPIGDEVKIVYDGEKESSKGLNPMKLFKVFIK